MDLSKYDETLLTQKWRKQCWRDGNRIKTHMWLDEVGARRDTSENEKKIMRSAYKKTMLEYWYYLDRGQKDAAIKQRERAQRMIKYVEYPVPDEGARDFLEKARVRQGAA